MYKTSCLEHFWKLKCRKGARFCGAKHMSKSTVAKLRGTNQYKALLLWFARQAHKILHLGKKKQDVLFYCSSFNVSTTTTTTLHNATSTTTATSTTATAATSTTTTTLNYLHCTTLHCTNSITVYTLRYTTLHYTSNCTTLHSITLD